MNQDLKDALDRLEAETHALTAAVDKQAEMLRVAIERLDAIIALLTPKEPEENGLSDLLARLVMIGGEQLALAQRSFTLLASIDERLPHATEGDDDVLARHGPRPL